MIEFLISINNKIIFYYFRAGNNFDIFKKKTSVCYFSSKKDTAMVCTKMWLQPQSVGECIHLIQTLTLPQLMRQYDLVFTTPITIIYNIIIIQVPVLFP